MQGRWNPRAHRVMGGLRPRAGFKPALPALSWTLQRATLCPRAGWKPALPALPRARATGCARSENMVGGAGMSRASGRSPGDWLELRHGHRPSAPTVAVLLAVHIIRNQQVRGSNPRVGSSITPLISTDYGIWGTTPGGPQSGPWVPLGSGWPQLGGIR